MFFFFFFFFYKRGYLEISVFQISSDDHISLLVFNRLSQFEFVVSNPFFCMCIMLPRVI